MRSCCRASVGSGWAYKAVTAAASTYKRSIVSSPATFYRHSRPDARRVMMMLRVHMKRRHWIEISDEPWCPQGIRRAATDYCRFVTEVSGIYNVVAPLLIETLQKTGD